jgi:acyl carrier protein
MTNSEISKHILESIGRLVQGRVDEITEDTPLIGDGSVLDSMSLVELCLSLEDLSDDLGFLFDWTSEVAMSRSRSMFRTAGSLIAEFVSQMGGGQ